MATKVIQLDGVGPVTLIKRKANRSLRLSIASTGIRVSMPHWTPFAAGEAFARSHSDWIATELAKQSVPRLESGQRIGKLHYLRFEHVLGGQSLSARVTATEVVVRLLTSEHTSDRAVQARAFKAGVRALKREAERLLPPRLQALATKYDKTYASVSVKQLKRRWGSCSSSRAISLNLFLMEVPWEYIDYVLLHELAHTIEMNHEPAFWRTLTAMQPDARALAKRLRAHQPTIGVWH